MDFEDSRVFDSPIDAVWAMFLDPASHVAKFGQMGHRDIEVVEHEADDGHLHLVVRRVVDVDLPGFAKRVVSPTNTVTTTDDWARQADGTITGAQAVLTEGAPVHITATTRLAPEGAGTRYTIAVRLDVKVPLIGGKIASWAKGTVQGQLDDEFAAGEAWLASH